VIVGPILGGSSDVALSANVAPLGDSHFDGCDLLQRSVVPYGACKALATIEDQHMSRECNERMWNLAYRLAHAGEHRNYQAIEWELQAYGYPQARQLLYHARVRERLDAICAEAQRSPSEAFWFWALSWGFDHHQYAAGSTEK
jgi:hypothetical protein